MAQARDLLCLTTGDANDEGRAAEDISLKDFVEDDAHGFGGPSAKECDVASASAARSEVSDNVCLETVCAEEDSGAGKEDAGEFRDEAEVDTAAETYGGYVSLLRTFEDFRHLHLVVK